jgi:hypothetical protein
MGTKILLYKYYIYHGSYELNKFMSLSLWSQISQILHLTVKNALCISKEKYVGNILIPSL